MNGTLENAMMAINGYDVQANNIGTPEEQSNKRRRKKSEVWQYFTAQSVSEDCTRACCNQCNRSFVYINGKKQSGTSHLRRHIINGVCPPKSVKQETTELFPHTPDSSQNGAITAPPRKRCRASPGSVNGSQNQENSIGSQNQENSINDMARMIIQHEYPTNMVEHSGFIEFAQNLQPQLSMSSVNSVQSEIMSIYRREKLSLANVLTEIPGRVSLSVDICTSDQNVSYAMLNAHFVDSDWKLQRRVLNFLTVPYPDSEVALNHAIVTCLSEWKLESKLFALSLDQSFANEAAIGNIRGLLSINNPHMINGQYLVAHCFARVISCLAKEAILSMAKVVSKVRDSVKFVKSSETREIKFTKLRQQLQVPSTEKLVLDNRDKWDSTYHMLSIACKLKEVFSCLDTWDPDYNLAPLMDDWNHVHALCACLKLFFDSSNILMDEKYPAAHTFFHQGYKIQVDLVQMAYRGNDPIIQDLVRPLSEKYDIYWRDCCLVLAMAVVMDPRFKLKRMWDALSKLYGDVDWASNIDENIHDLYFEYVAQTLPLSCIHVNERYDDEFMKNESSLQDEVASSSGEGNSDFDVYISDLSSNDETRSELDQYLEEDLLISSDGVDVIEWWKLNRIRYPTLSKMAADLLSIPFSTLHRESVFDSATKKVDSHLCSLRPSNLEAIVCAKDWLQYESSSVFHMISSKLF